ncbi:hypothetical protein F2P81_023307 [Scophthalmus maximus]|uniref:Uncharacterized protein n=1 Tax=Scophthalmus maximus TaxID=52904 RepID=A0A6A4RWD2_SCOMX|nr:hypothetical protein F2P81_023307 [Scophthalmus maximus]
MASRALRTREVFSGSFTASLSFAADPAASVCPSLTNTYSGPNVLDQSEDIIKGFWKALTLHQHRRSKQDNAGGTRCSVTVTRSARELLHHNSGVSTFASRSELRAKWK